VLPEVGEAASGPGAGRDRLEGAAEAADVEALRARGRHHRVVEARDARDPDRLSVRERALTSRRPPAAAERGRRDDAEDDLAVPLEREQRRVDRDAADVALRAVDRIEDPADRRGSLGAALLLTVHGLTGPLPFQPLADRALDSPVRVRDRGQVGLRLDPKVGGPEARQRDRVGEVDERMRELEVCVHGSSLAAPPAVPVVVPVPCVVAVPAVVRVSRVVAVTRVVAVPVVVAVLPVVGAVAVATV
jgi:hypothetical protein